MHQERLRPFHFSLVQHILRVHLPSRSQFANIVRPGLTADIYQKGLVPFQFFLELIPLGILFLTTFAFLQ